MKVYLIGTDAEEWPDGTFGGPRPTHIPHPDPNAGRHCAELIDALRRKPPDTRTDEGAGERTGPTRTTRCANPS